MTETKITLTPEEMAGNQYAALCSGAYGCTSSTFGTPVYVTDSNPNDTSPDVVIRRIVAEELAKSEERIAEMVIRKLNDQIKLQAGIRG